MRPDDVLVSRRTARADAYAVGVVSARSDTTHVRYEEGIAAGRELARILGVDAWFTCDHLHFARLAR